MGREWLYKTSASGGDGSRGGGRLPSATTTAVNRKTGKEKNYTNSSSGCMSAIFNLFDNQHHHLRFRHPSFISESTITNHQNSNFCLQGVEAPRNSLESPESAIDDALSSTTKVKEQSNLNIPMVGIQIKTKRSRFPDDLSSECSSSSPGTKTPNLVARLMGLDLLPEYSSPRPSASSTPANSHHRSRSLPTTPRSSTTSRRSTDNDYHHRLSLQIDKENCNRCKGQEHESLQMKMARRRSELMVNRQDHEDRASQYAKQITNQVKERISRRLGTDITNVISPATRNNKEHRRDSNLVLLKPKKTSTLPQAPPPSPVPETSVKAKQDENSTPFSSSKKLRFLDFKNNLNKPISNSRLSSLKEVASKPEIAVPGHRTPLTKQGKPVKDEKIKRIASERYDLRLKKMNQQEDAFVNKKKKSTLLPNHVVDVKNTTKFRSFKKQMTSSSSTTRLPQKRVSLHSNLNSSYNANDTHTHNTTTTVANGCSFSDHFDYISRILKHCGIHTNIPISTCQWYSPAHPLHPSIFHQLEKSHHAATTAATRRLIFELVNELLVEILKPYMNQKPWVYSRPPDSCVMRGSELIGKLCERIGSFPAADCEVLEDIDGLIEKDLGWSMRRQGMTAFEAEAEDIVKEIENEMVEMMVTEMTNTAGDGGAGRI